MKIVSTVYMFFIGSLCLFAQCYPADTSSSVPANPFQFIQAVFKYDTEKLKMLCSSKEKNEMINAQDDQGMTALHYASRMNDLTCVSILLGGGADPNIQNHRGRTPLYCAAERGHHTIVTKLLENGADPEIRNHDSQTPRMIAQKNDKLDCVQAIDQYPRLLGAVKAGNIELVKALLLTDIDPNAEQDDQGRTPLHFAAIQGNEEMTQLLLAHYADFRKTDRRGKTPLAYALDHEHFNIIKAIQAVIDKVEKARVQRALERSYTIAATASGAYLKTARTASGAYLETAGTASEPRFEPNAVVLPDKKTLLHSAVIKEDINTIKKLFKCFVNPNARDSDGKTPLHYAVITKNHEIIKLLVTAGAQSYIKDRDGKTPLDIALNKEDLISLIKQRYTINQPDAWGRTPLHRAVISNNIDRVKILLSTGAHPNNVDYQCKTPLHYATITENIAMVHVLCATDLTALDIQDMDGNTALHYAIQLDDKTFAQFLIAAKANLDISNAAGDTPLHSAAYDGDTKSIEMLLSSGAQTTIQNKLGETAADVAKKYGKKRQYDSVTMKYRPHTDQLSYPLTPNTSPYSHTALSNAVEWGSLENIVTLLSSLQAEEQAQGKRSDTNKLLTTIKEIAQLSACKNKPNILKLLYQIYQPDMLPHKTILNDYHASSYAAILGYIEIIKILIAAGIDVNQDSDKYTLITDSIQYITYGERPADGLTILKMLFAAGANPNPLKPGWASPLIESIAYYKECLKKPLKTTEASYPDGTAELIKRQVQILLAAGSSPYIIKDGRTPFMVALKQKLLDCAQLIWAKMIHQELHTPAAIETSPRVCSAAGELVEASAACDETLLSSFPQVVKYTDDIRTIRTLLLEGIDPNITDDTGNAALHYAAITKCSDILELLLNNTKVNLNIQNKQKQTPLHLAFMSGNTDAVALLIIHGADITISDDHDKTPLDISYYNHKMMNNDELFEIFNLAEHNITPLHYFSKRGNRAKVALLLKQFKKDRPKLIKYINTPQEESDTCQYYPLHLAVQQGHLDIINMLLEPGGDVNAQDIYKMTPLHYAACLGRMDIIETLIAHGADIHATDKFKRTPLYYGIVYNHAEVIRTFLREGANPIIFDYEGSNNILEYASQDVLPIMINAIKDHRMAHALHMQPMRHICDCLPTTIPALLNAHPDLATEDIEGNTLMHVAAWNGNTEVIKTLIKQGLNPNVCNMNGATPLHIAAYDNHIELVEFLVNLKDEDGRCVIDVNAQDIDENTPLHLAVKNECEQVITILKAAHANDSLLNKYRQPAWNMKANPGYDLVYSGSDGWRSKFLKKLSLQNIFILPEQFSFITSLYTKQPFYLKDHDLLTALFRAIPDKHKIDENGHTFLHYAAWDGYYEFVQELLKHGADPNIQGLSGQTPLHYAIIKGHLKIVQALLENRANKDIQDHSGRTPLDYMKIYPYQEIIKYFDSTQSITYAFHDAAEKGDAAVMIQLLDLDRDPNAKNDEGETPLHKAAQAGKLNAIQLLLDHNANPTLLDKKSHNPLFWAETNNHTECIELLREAISGWIEKPDYKNRKSQKQLSIIGKRIFIQKAYNFHDSENTE